MLEKARADLADLQRELASVRTSSNSAQERELMELKNRNEYLQKSLDDKVLHYSVIVMTSSYISLNLISKYNFKFN